MLSQDDDGLQALLLSAVFGLVAVVLALVMGVAIAHRPAGHSPQDALPGQPVAQPRPDLTAATQDAANAVQAALDAASIKVEYGVVKFYFASGKTELAPGAMDALADLVKNALAGGRTLVVSGFHDATGDARKNAALAGQRALAVRDALRAAGVPMAQIALQKPAQIMDGATTAGGVVAGDAAEARRVEVALQ